MSTASCAFLAVGCQLLIMLVMLLVMVLRCMLSLQDLRPLRIGARRRPAMRHVGATGLVLEFGMLLTGLLTGLLLVLLLMLLLMLVLVLVLLRLRVGEWRDCWLGE